MRHRFMAFGDRDVRILVSDNGARFTFDPTEADCWLVIDGGHSHRIATLAGAAISANSLWSVHEDLSAGRLVRVLPGYELAEDTALWLLYPQATYFPPKSVFSWIFCSTASEPARPGCRSASNSR